MTKKGSNPVKIRGPLADLRPSLGVEAKIRRRTFRVDHRCDCSGGPIQCVSVMNLVQNVMFQCEISLQVGMLGVVKEMVVENAVWA